MSSGGVESRPLYLDVPSSSLLFSEKAEAFTVPSCLLEQTLPTGLLERRDGVTPSLSSTVPSLCE